MRAMLFITLLLPPILWGVLDTLPKVWSNGETIRASDLNSDMSHLHSALDHVENQTIANADIATNAAIAHTKLAHPELVAKGWFRCQGRTTAGSVSCILTSDISGVTRLSTGNYRATMATSRGADGGLNDYTVVGGNLVLGIVSGKPMLCVPSVIHETTFDIECSDVAYQDGGTSFDNDPTTFSFAVFGSGV